MPRLRTLSQISFFCSLSLAFFLLFSLLASSPLQEHLILHESIDQVPQQFIHLGPADPTQQLSLSFAMKPRNITGLALEVEAISDPAHPKYTQFLTREQVRTII